MASKRAILLVTVMEQYIRKGICSGVRTVLPFEFVEAAFARGIILVSTLKT